MHARAITAFAGLTRFDVSRTGTCDNFRQPVLPDDVGAVHALYQHPRVAAMRHHAVTKPQFYRSPTSYRGAWCGAAIKVVLPVAFDVGDDDACQRCVSAMLAGEPVRRPAWSPEDGEQ